jgi:predicted amidohydrolase YtcJ
MKLISITPSTMLLLIVGIAVSACHSRKEVADLVLRNSTIYTVDASFSIAQAVAVQGDRIVKVGTNDEIAAWIGPETRVIELNGKTVVPGLIDSHYHFQSVGKRAYDLNLDGCVSLEDFQTRLKNWAAGRPPGEWITGRGWMEEDWPVKEFPTRRELDAVVADHPVYLNRADGHLAVVNSKALELGEITRATPNPEGGEILKESGGAPNGLLVDRAMGLVTRKIPTGAREWQEKYALKANEVALAYGWTTIHDAGSSWDTINLWKELYNRDRLQVRLYSMLRGPGTEVESLLQQGPQLGLHNNHLSIRCIKISVDGALGSRGAALLDKYSDAETKGLFLFKDEEVYPIIKATTQGGIQMALHAIGDAANRKALDFFEQAQNEVPAGQRKIREPRHRIEHAQVVHPDDLPRFRSLGVIPSMQASHAIGDLHFAPRRLGPERLAGAYAWRTLIDSGCFIPGGSDAPVEEGDPMLEFYAAVARRDTAGFANADWHAELKMSREEALRSLTNWGAYAAFEENEKGSIAPGKLADFAVLNGDPMTAPEETLFRIRNVMTIVGGKVVFERAPLAAAGDAD